MAKAFVLNNSQQVYSWLKSRYGIPQFMINKMKMALAQDALAKGQGLGYDRIYGMVALALWRAWQCDDEKIMEIMKAIDAIATEIETGETSWSALMEELANNTGIIIRSDRDGAVGDYHAEDEVDAN
jgi:hypothetical protein